MELPIALQVRSEGRLGRRVGERVIPMDWKADSTLAQAQSMAASIQGWPSWSWGVPFQWIHIWSPLWDQGGRDNFRWWWVSKHCCWSASGREPQQSQGVDSCQGPEDHIWHKKWEYTTLNYIEISSCCVNNHGFMCILDVEMARGLWAQHLSIQWPV